MSDEFWDIVGGDCSDEGMPTEEEFERMTRSRGDRLAWHINQYPERLRRRIAWTVYRLQIDRMINKDD